MSISRVVWVMILLMAASVAHGAIYQKDPVPGYDCAGDMTTANCFGPTATAGGTTATACVASGANRQRCRDCMTAYDIWGVELSYSTCNYVARRAACDCTPSGSSHCTGNTSSTCTYNP